MLTLLVLPVFYSLLAPKGSRLAGDNAIGASLYWGDLPEGGLA
jgi:hypothetical protein